MGVRFYDEAMYEKLQKWIKDPNLVILKPDESARLWKVRVDQINDKPIRLPLIALSRESQIQIQHNKKHPLSFDGVRIDSSKTGTIHLDAVPISITYIINIYTQRFEECDEYVRNFVFQIINHPKLEIDIPYNNVNLKHIAYMRLEDRAEDNSDITEKLFDDQFTRWTLRVNIQDAYMFSAPVSPNASLESIEVEVGFPNDPASVEEIYVKK